MREPQEILAELNGHYSLRLESISFLRQGGCQSYVVSGRFQRYFLKIVPPAFLGTARQSVDILRYLSGRGFPVPGIVLTKDGQPYWEADAAEESCIYVLFDYIDGAEPEQGEDIESIGSLAGRLHRDMQGYGGGLAEHGRQFFIGRFLEQMQRKGYPEKKIAAFREYGDALWKSVEHLPRGYCHGDLHRGNLLRAKDGQYFILDFDTSCKASPVFDVMAMCDATDYFRFGRGGYEITKRIFERFLAGYLQYGNLTGEEIASFYDWVAIRHYQLQATILEINGLDCVDAEFLDRQLDWLQRWREQCGTV